ncbi:hypothetical protein O9G_006228 [Rozella allomycis CSF55]|nr:hypothetical protein O9G_006228 [Rozella allomycis CSF55]|eukprot:EPZ31196.1 hypothetical protein O9G_006228 [Rozella allomycis CSF55]
MTIHLFTPSSRNSKKVWFNFTNPSMLILFGMFIMPYFQTQMLLRTTIRSCYSGLLEIV